MASTSKRDKWVNGAKWLVVNWGLPLITFVVTIGQIKESLASEARFGNIETEVDQSKPLNQLVSSIDLVVSVQLKGAGFVEWPMWGSPSVAHATLCDNRTNIGPAVVGSSRPLYSTLGEWAALRSSDIGRVEYKGPHDDAATGHGYSIRFTEQMFPGSDFEVSYPTRVKDITEHLRAILIGVKIIPNDSEVMGGDAILVINGIARMRFVIPPQKAYPWPEGLGTNVNASGFTFVATNGLLAPLAKKR